MSTWQLTVEHRIAAPPVRVWETMTDIEGSPNVISGVERVELLSDAPFGVGTRWRETRLMFGEEATEEMWVSACEAPTRYVVEADSRGVHYTSEFTLAPDGDDATSVRLVFGGSRTEKNALGGVIGKLFGGIGARTVEKALTKDLEDIAASAESPH
ncbi:SRPBCC family protein [Streptomyces sp. HNM0575]|uniref:SRPBCC family protein n=1 Tax=Streptomyces sp. HNM0575 TaxID=2716338 RepID=UPI00145DC6DF|nr:SRPBCC family protein [Streptomyces sp. HNM0575]NLU75618.1 SRPBCC family protein [Streptomyces sp. HNM0575]